MPSRFTIGNTGDDSRKPSLLSPERAQVSQDQRLRTLSTTTAPPRPVEAIVKIEGSWRYRRGVGISVVNERVAFLQPRAWLE
jgi:hypothetical protein